MHITNLVQFIPKALLATESGIATHAYEKLIDEGPAPSDTVNIDPKWKDIIDGLFDASLIDMAKRLRDEGIIAPESGLYSEEDDTPMSEYKWPDKKILVQSEDEEAYKEQLQGQGWKVFSSDYDGVLLALKEE